MGPRQRGVDGGGAEGGAFVAGGESGRKDEGVRLGGGEGMPRGRRRRGEVGRGVWGAVTAHIQRDAPLHIHQAVAN